MVYKKFWKTFANRAVVLIIKKYSEILFATFLTMCF